MKRDEHLVLHGLAIKKYGDAASVAGLLGLEAERVTKILQDGVAKGRVNAIAGRYALAPIARVALASEYPKHFADIRANERFVHAYEEFERLNVTLKALITDWQTIPVAGSMVPNTHADKAYDERVIDRLGALNERAAKMMAALAAEMPRMAIYQRKLQEALEKAEDGAIEWVSDAKIESYHTTWFELHEDLLCMLGKQRQE